MLITIQYDTKTFSGFLSTTGSKNDLVDGAGHLTRVDFNSFDLFRSKLLLVASFGEEEQNCSEQSCCIRKYDKNNQIYLRMFSVREDLKFRKFLEIWKYINL